jgi:hypothetical protein
VTAVTSFRCGKPARYLGASYGSTPTPKWVSCNCRSGQALVSNPPNETAAHRYGPSKAGARRQQLSVG